MGLAWWRGREPSRNTPTLAAPQASFICLLLHSSNSVRPGAFPVSSPFLYIALLKGKHLCLVRKPQIFFICFASHLMFHAPKWQGYKNWKCEAPWKITDFTSVSLVCGGGRGLALGYTPGPVNPRLWECTHAHTQDNSPSDPAIHHFGVNLS